MLAASFVLDADDIRRFNLDCRPWIEGDEEILGDGTNIIVTPTTDPAFFITVAYPTTTPEENTGVKNRLVFLTGGGKPGEDYMVDFNVLTSYGQRRTVCVRFTIAQPCEVAA